ncbi:MAG: arsenate reductase (glutaredoxin) [Crocinitomicaceae bacterium]
MSDKYTVYHNPRCSKSRMAMEYLNDAGKDVQVVEYLKENPTKDEIVSILKKLNLPAQSIIRKSEPAFKENFKGQDLTEGQWVDAMVRFPKLIERPIVIRGDKAVVARPTELIDNLD